ncbi:prepilin-type N-terminal cleavage/methylation domain-containing protein [Paraglaciecola polaris]|uniref:MSHA pilin protein MshC n=1 Tax=Paraglaciecola polaris LMG 21857 TaxID=1129793 RepID=K6YN42_9ALTE|nr:prepilin-type N-terminal cleavage/methylation domain-containing protein [Paraglaciecola polaris]GAC34114.1 MSHA pilin protein MshC [Paraglaciecola polaris LMG 21857]|tara:strand:+ start:3467 stop:4036 length:570 start_codon:yes stop_codon:yes gene_type:complete
MKTLRGKDILIVNAVQRGFTLIELIVVILIIGILAVSAASRFDSTGYAEYSYQSRLLSALRAMQQRAMQDTRDNYCFQINFNIVSPAFGPPTLSYRNDTQAEHTATCATAINYSTPEFLRTSSGEIAADGISMMTLDTGNGVFNYMRFDSFGRPITSAGNCQATCRITFQGSQSPAICVESEGYIHECS